MKDPFAAWTLLGLLLLPRANKELDDNVERAPHTSRRYHFLIVEFSYLETMVFRSSKHINLRGNRSKGLRLIAFCLPLCLGLCVPSLNAQSVSSALEGLVQDASGGVVPGASVVLTNLGTGGILRTETSDVGRYTFPSILPAPYTLTVSKAGFETYEESQFKVVVAQQATIDVTLTVGSSSQSITVQGSGLAPLLQPNSNDLGSLIEPSSVQELPLNGRNFLQLGLLSGASQSSGGTNSDAVTAQTGHPGLSINLGGGEQDYTLFLINGMATTGSRVGDASLNLSLGAIDQFQVHYGFFLPDLGIDPGIVDVITKGGGNNLHGEAFEFLRNNNLEARNFLSNVPPGPFHLNQFGGDVAGRIRRDKLFYFANYEGERQDQSAFTGAFAPTAAMFEGNFSAISTPLYNPFSYNAATVQRAAFTGNVIPPGMINTVAKNLLPYYLPGSSYAQTPINVSGTPLSKYDYDQYTGRVDANLNERNTFYAQFSSENSPVVNSSLFPLAGTEFPLNTQLAMAQWAWTISPSLVNELRAGWTRGYIFNVGQSQAGVQNAIGITGTADPNGIPGITLNGIGSFGRKSGLNGNIDNVYQLHDALSWLRGNHQIKFGADLDYTRSIQQDSNGNARGSLSFSGGFSSQLTTNASGKPVVAAGTGNSFADFLLGVPTNGLVSTLPRMDYRWTLFDPYAQDSWKVRPGLTLNAGLGWFVETPPNPSGADAKLPHSVDFATGQVLFAALGQISPEVVPDNLTNFAPRVGLAWQPGFSKQTVVRAGWGIYYASGRVLFEQAAINATGVTISQSIANSQPAPTYLLGQNVFPVITLAPITQAFANNLSGDLYDMPSNNRTPYVEQWNLDVEHTFTPRYLLDVSYVGNEGHHETATYNGDDCSVPGSLVCNPAAVPFKQFSFIGLFAANSANSNYQALVVKFQRQFSGGLSLLANYTYSKTLTNSFEGSGGGVSLSQIAACRRCDKGLAAFNVPQALRVSTVYSLPFGKGKRFVKDATPTLNGLLGGWGLDAITTFQGGNPFEVTSPNTTAVTFVDYRANRLCNGRSEVTNTNLRTDGFQFLDTSCFAKPLSGYFGTGGFDILNGPGENNWDIGIHKDTQIHESVRLQFRAEFFNAWNHAQFANPDNGVADVNFGRISTTQQPAREIQFGLKLLW